MFLLVSLPNAKDYLQQSADPRNQEDCTDEMALCEAIMLQTQSLGQNQGDGNDTSKCSQTVLRGQSWGKTEIRLIVVGFTHLKKGTWLMFVHHLRDYSEGSVQLKSNFTIWLTQLKPSN